MFARLFYWESQQKKICKFIKSISREDLDQDITSISARENYVIGSEIKNNLPNDSRYYKLYFYDYERGQDPNEYFISRKVTAGILEVNKNGQLTILDNNFNMKETIAGFIFDTDEGLMLASKNAINNAEREMNTTRKIFAVTGCIGVAALALTAVRTFKR